MGASGRTETTGKQKTSLRKWCFLLTIAFAIVLIIFYSLQIKPDNIILKENITNFDEEKFRVIKRMLENLKKERGEQTTWRSTVTKIIPWRKTKQDKLVLLYTGFFGNTPWGWLKDTSAFNVWEGMTCPFYRCSITYDKSLFKKSDAVLFHAEDLSPGAELDALQLARPNTQRWVYFPTESPVNVPESHIVNDVFNWTMSFRPSSDIFRPYGFYYPVDKNYERPESLLEFLESKDLLAVWLASHCGLLRDKYIRRLKQFMNIDVYGKCGSGVGGTSGKCIQDSPDCKKHLKRYKFFFAFENSFCTDYITEKYWFSLMLGVVPVVLGGASYDETVAIPGSYINAMNFTSIKALAEYLKRLDNNDKEYNKFFEWRNKYKVVASAPWACQLCAALHIDQKPKVQDHLDVFWGRYQQCGRKEDFIKKVIDEQPLTPIKHKYSGR
ncbi:3-galactosyl-N-acetylglucosaminide 4-alpha-L-fucosyltransferase FUT3 [Nematostella vectensis]|uniref:3-galactosyl-N-acetylglucosaminide 4-alpha-L-fucosyltransferase FUT3 n=1 Tax=Nematostella vectensis TaxID=45351 RepID=UPI0020774AD6|nr:3-galactosyl-N-acetylglucosaminide 4-alpha-L-fucosyltransferase FUT3 [Nematostella vectensis]